MTKNDIAWDMSSVFPSVTDPSIDKTIDKLNEMASGLVTNYQGKIEKLSAKGLLKLLQDYEEFLIESGNIGMYARLTFAANMTLPESQQLNDRMSKIQAENSKKLAFLILDAGKLVYNKKELIKDPILSNYKHYLEKLVRAVPHQLSEIEEQLIIGKDQFGIRGWQQLQSKWLNTRMFDVKVEGEMKQLSYGQANALLPHKDRETRKAANKSIYGLLRNDGEIFSSAMRSIFNDWEAITVRRKYDSEMHASLIANDISQEVISNLLKAIDEHSHIYRRYLKLKAKMLGLPKLANYDITAPLPDAPDIKYDFKKAEELVTDAYSKFDEDYAFATKDMFKQNHIDASPRFGKRNGAFCASWYKGKSAFMLQSFND
ncbi:MAG: M3 family metallopeptidase, partial [Candidatus Heimdallarchaeota archaeon]